MTVSRLTGGYIYSHVIACTGWSWDAVRWQMDLPRYAAMSRYWDIHPPLHLMVQGYLGIEAKSSRPATTVNSAEDLDEFMQMFSGASGLIN